GPDMARAAQLTSSFLAWFTSAALFLACSSSGDHGAGNGAGGGAFAGNAGTTGATSNGFGGGAGSPSTPGAAGSGASTTAGTASAGGSAGSGSPSAGAAGTGDGATGSTEPYPLPESGSLKDEDGSSLWLRYPKVPIPGRLAEYQAAFKQVVSSTN